MATMKKDYLNVVYDNRPKTDYPDFLAGELMRRFALLPGMSLLDVGCGKGDMLQAFQRAGMNVVGLDNAPSALTRDDAIEIRQCDIIREIYPCPDNSFDAVFAKSVIEHIVDPAYMLEEIRRVLKPEGILILLTPDFAKLHTVFYEDPTHVRPYVPKGLENLLAMHGYNSPVSELFCHHQNVWRGGLYALVAKFLQVFLSVKMARWLTEKTNIKFIRWATERQVLASARN